MTEANSANCKAKFAALDKKSRRALFIDDAFPLCACEGCSIGEGSPGKVADCEEVYRFFVTPVDVDERTNQVTQTAFERAATNGLSVFRGCASNEDIKNLVQDCLTVKPGQPLRTILGLVKATVADVRAIQNETGSRAFCVYDETVTRKLDESLPHIPTHVSVYQRVPAAGIEGRKRTIESDNFELYKLFILQQIEVASFRGGLLLELNRRSLAGEFVGS